MDPRTFVRPAELHIQPVPRVGEPAPDPPGPAYAGHGQVICFLRHAGCPFAEATLRDMQEMRRKHPEVAAVAVGHAPRQAAAKWRSNVGGAEGIDCIDDPTRHIYAEWGLGLTEMKHFAGTDSLKGVANLLGSGIRNRHPSGTRWQGAGAFAVDGKGTVRWVHIPRHAGDLPDLDAAVQALG
jgi:hypothetical protein